MHHLSSLLYDTCRLHTLEQHYPLEDSVSCGKMCKDPQPVLVYFLTGIALLWAWIVLLSIAGLICYRVDGCVASFMLAYAFLCLLFTRLLHRRLLWISKSGNDVFIWPLGSMSHQPRMGSQSLLVVVTHVVTKGRELAQQLPIDCGTQQWWPSQERERSRAILPFLAVSALWSRCERTAPWIASLMMPSHSPSATALKESEYTALRESTSALTQTCTLRFISVSSSALFAPFPGQK